MEVSRSMAKPPTHRIYYGLPLTIYPSHVRICLPYIHGSVMGNNLRRIFRCQFRKRPSLSLVWLTRNAVMKKNSRRYAEGCDYDLCEMCYKHHLEGWASAVQRRQFFFWFFAWWRVCTGYMEMHIGDFIVIEWIQNHMGYHTFFLHVFSGIHR